MKSSLKVKLLQHLAAKKSDNAGFTLIELLVVIIIIGILSAIALPSFLNQANKAKQSEAKTYVGSMNRAQQAFYLEKNGFVDGVFTATKSDGTAGAVYTIEDLGLGINTATEYYNYSLRTDVAKSVTNVAAPKDPNAQTASSLKAYIGGVSIGTQTNTGEATTLAALCEANDPKIANGGATGAETITLNADGFPLCPDIYSPVK